MDLNVDLFLSYNKYSSQYPDGLKRMFKKIIYITIIICLVLVKAVSAQFDVRLTSTYGNISLNPVTDLNIHIDHQSFITTGLQVDYYISDNLGFGLGIDYHIRDGKFDIILSDYNHKYKGIDNWGVDPIPREYEFTIKSNAPDIVEQNTMSFVDFPVSWVWRIPINDKLSLDTRFGVKMGFPLNSNYELKESDLYTRLYFEEWDLELFNIPAHGLYDSRTDWHPNGEISINKVFSIFSEIGLDFPMSLVKVRVSGFFSYGLNNIISDRQSSLIYWREKYNNILRLPERVNMMQYGVKLSIGMKNIRRKTKCGGILY